MKLATLRDGTRDGALLIVSRDLARAAPAAGIAATLQEAVELWTEIEPALRTLAARVEAGDAPGLAPLDPHRLAAPLPRAWQWLDASAFPSHGALMQRAFDLPPIESDRPLMYQGMSDHFLGPLDDVPFPAEADGIDFEGEYGIITGDVPIGCSEVDALGHIRLLVQINDWSLRAIAPVEMKTGFGWVQAKPACSMAPIAVTPDELGDTWRDGRVCLPLRVEWNGVRFGEPDGAEMAIGFHDLIAHAARTRALTAGTVIGSGTVSNEKHADVGSCCISERRAIEMIADGAARTDFMRFGDRVRMEVLAQDGTSVFGQIDQTVVSAG